MLINSSMEEKRSNEKHKKSSIVTPKKPLDPQNLFKIAPQPLFSKKHNLALLWSAKAGCTFSVKWFFDKIGFLDVALFYHPWIHRFRTQVFCESVEYKRYLKNRNTVAELLEGEIKIIKVVCNPFSRVVSSYLAAIKGITAAQDNYDTEKIRNFLGREVNEKDTFSFREFVAYLESLDISFCNIHWRIQQHKSEKVGLIVPNYIVHLENSYEQLRQIEIELGLNTSNFDELRKSAHHSKRLVELEGCFADEHFTFLDKDVAFPPSKNFYDDTLKKAVANLYQVDFESYGYDKNMTL
jgi:hypothetical protein